MLVTSIFLSNYIEPMLNRPSWFLDTVYPLC